MIVAVSCIVGALIIGITANAFLASKIQARNKAHSIPPMQGSMGIAGIWAPVATLTVFFLGFALLNGGQSYSRAKAAAQVEAAVVDTIYETSAYIEQPYRRRLQRSAVCYARAVAGPEWDAMAKGGSERSAVPSNWTGDGHNGIRKTFQDMGPSAALFTTLLAADQSRGDSRRERLTEAAPKVPSIVLAFLLITISGCILFFAVASPRLNPLHLAAVTGAALVLLFAVFVVRSLDRPFSGPLAIDNTAILNTAEDISEDFIKEYGQARVRCDVKGNPTGSAS